VLGLKFSEAGDVKFDIFQIAADIVSRAGEKPADQVLRETLKRHRDLAPFETAEISALVFDYFRWQQWLRDEKSVEAGLREAHVLATRFDTIPASF
jgi:hypothetical protein